MAEERKIILGFDVGAKTLLPYLLNQKIKIIDYIIVSHFDTDHIKGLFTVIEKLKVKNIIIGEQFEITNNYKELIKIANKKRIRMYITKAGQRINIEKDLYLDILWPNPSNVIIENCINNNSLVFKFIYKNLSILFTGDIEEIAEVALLEKYKSNYKILESTVLKVAHHRFKNIFYRSFLKRGKA